MKIYPEDPMPAQPPTSAPDHGVRAPAPHDAETGHKPKPVTIHVNEQPVRMPDDHATGREIKEAAIAQGVRIELDFPLVEELPNGRTRNVGNDDEVKLKKTSRFLANDGDDNS